MYAGLRKRESAFSVAVAAGNVSMSSLKALQGSMVFGKVQSWYWKHIMSQRRK